ncbi:MAG: Mur ligase domain-containing protein, partial [Oscillospiraceae bacterium]
MSHITEQELQGFKRLHFIGIGGSGMFPLVQILNKENFIITGSDNNSGDNLLREADMGIQIHMGHSEENVKGADAVIFSAAIMEDNPELLYAREHKIPTIERSELLGLLSRRYSNCICISGTHGKTTTTAMLTQILLSCGMDPSCVIG